MTPIFSYNNIFKVLKNQLVFNDFLFQKLIFPIKSNFVIKYFPGLLEYL